VATSALFARSEMYYEKIYILFLNAIVRPGLSFANQQIQPHNNAAIICDVEPYIYLNALPGSGRSTSPPASRQLLRLLCTHSQELNQVEHNKSDSDARYDTIFWLPCSSLAIRSASSIKSVPNPVLKLSRISAVQRHRRTIDMQFTDQTRLLTGQFGRMYALDCISVAEQANQDVLLWILISEEGLPPAVGCVVPPYELNLRWTGSCASLINSNFPGSNITAGSAKVFHSTQASSAEVPFSRPR